MEIEKNISKGMSSTTIGDILNINETEVKKKHKELFEKLVKDEQLRELLSLEENISKVKTRLEIKTKALGENGETLGELITVGRKTIREVITELSSKLQKGMGFDDFYNQIKYVLSQQGYSYKPEKKGNLNKLEMKVIFRKG